jgi:hypothetical protein
MALKAHEREVIYADIIVRRRAEQAPYPPLSALADLWRRAKDEKLPPKKFEKGTVTAIIADFDQDLLQDSITLLISVADPNASDATYADHVKRSSRDIAKTATEGNEHSAHVVISLKERAGHPQTYACLIERVPTLSTMRLQSILNDVIGRYCKADTSLFTFKAAGGAKTAKPYVPNVLVETQASDEFLKDIETGTLSGLRLSKPAVSSAGTSMGPFLKLQDYSLNVKISPDLPQGDRWKTIKKAMIAKSAEFQTARLYLKPAGAASSSSVQFDATTGNLLGEAYARKRRIGPLSPLLRNGAEKIVPHLETEMLKLLLAEA